MGIFRSGMAKTRQSFFGRLGQMLSGGNIDDDTWDDIEALLIQVQQSVLCNALHPVESRLSRWLLLMQDRADTDTLPLTQEFLAGMLGVNRTTVTSAARHLQSVGLISYRRGVVHIRKRAALEDASCECYRIARSHYQRLLAAP